MKAPHGPPPNGTPDGLPLHYRPAVRGTALGPPILWNGGTFSPFERKSPSPRLLFCYTSPNGRGVARNLPSTIIFAIKICLSHLVCKLHLVLHFLRGTVSSRFMYERLKKTCFSFQQFARNRNCAEVQPPFYFLFVSDVNCVCNTRQRNLQSAPLGWTLV